MKTMQLIVIVQYACDYFHVTITNADRRNFSRVHMFVKCCQEFIVIWKGYLSEGDFAKQQRRTVWG